MRTITLEEHFVSPGFLNGPGKAFTEQIRSRGPAGARIYDQLQNIGAERIAEMDAAGIDMQVLSLNAPGLEQTDAPEQIVLAAEANDFVAAAIRMHPARLSAFAALPTASPDKAAHEFERRVRQDGFKGANINGHTRGRYLDDQFFSPILECAEALGVPVYLHPTIPPKAVCDSSYSGFSAPVSAMFASAAWGWHIETATHLIRMVLGGVFDRFPNLQVIIGHLGEGIPFMLPRLERNFPQSLTQLKRPTGSYFRENVYYTFGGFNFATTFQNLLQEVGANRILFSVDYPYGSMVEAQTFLGTLPLAERDRQAISHRNAETLLHL
jgi:predicted TIM-barrel fold metal-dependent hydrolase